MTSSSILPLVAALFFEGHAKLLQPYEAVEAHMGTLFRIKLYAQNASEAQAAFRAAFERVSELDATLTDYREDSELSKSTQSGVGRPVTMSQDLFRVLRASQNIAERTDGAFDITLGPLTHLWRTARQQGVLPESSAREEARQRCGFHKLHLTEATSSAVFDLPHMQLDAGGIAKGYAADEAIVRLRAAGISQALVAASGDLVFSDAPPGTSGWRIGIDSFDDAGQPFTRVLLLKNAAVSTSGDTEQHLDKAGQRYSHILDPESGMALTNRLVVTVVASNGMEADAASTAISVLGEKDGLAFVEKSAGMAALIVNQTNQPATVVASKNFELLTTEKAKQEKDK